MTMIKRLKYVFLLVSIAGRMLAFSSEDIDTGRVKGVDLPAGHSILVPSYFEVGTGASGGHDSLSFADPEGYLYGTVGTSQERQHIARRQVLTLDRLISGISRSTVL